MEHSAIVAKNVRLYRELAVLSIRELAEQAGVTASAIWGIESGRHSPHPKTLRKIAAALGVAPGELLKPRLL